MTDPARVIRDLRELATLTSTDQGAQRVAWTPVWQRARTWFAEKLGAIGLQRELDKAGNAWATMPGRSPATIILGSHLDSVPNGGWLDGALGMLAALEALRVFRHRDLPWTAERRLTCPGRNPLQGRPAMSTRSVFQHPNAPALTAFALRCDGTFTIETVPSECSAAVTTPTAVSI